ncbi:response regulator [Rhizobium sp. P32RR-XVIII]|uniref:sensor histidine kinase n=1 Tax=Rhizobium sp. P32RR-XVIII TaxID=2726738 RepID=UPI0014564BC2|nr:histidine kinase dimerization/phosphoacceptor domain -containing protein [Rhizobium sp. P32RR-XVIII]NLS04923.1 response regulator [Rhizobium sp. P32RR-XVIII]
MGEAPDDAKSEIRILYVDEDEMLGLLMQEHLTQHGFEVEWVQDGAAALRRIADGGIDAVVLDHTLETELGLDFLPQLMALPDRPPVVYATGANDTGIAVAALKAGADDYVLKGSSPDYFDLVAATLEQSLERARFRRETAEAQELIRQQRDRAELLLAEVNHRVANSLGLVGALIRMQSSILTDQVAIDALHETQSRINAIASVHRRLYDSRQIGKVQVDEYLQNFLSELEASIRDDKRPHRIVLTAGPINLPTDKVVTLGLIVGELVTNAFKYAYREGVHGEIRVIVERFDEELHLVVEDDGGGFDHSSPARGSGLGTKILTAMAASLKSELTYDPACRGTRAILIFPVS